MRVSKGVEGGLGPKPCSASMPPGVWATSGGEGLPLPSETPLLLPLPGFSSLFLAVTYAKKGGGEGRVGWGARWEPVGAGTGPVRKEPSSPLRPAPSGALSHGVPELGGGWGWPDWRARPWGQRGPPSRGAGPPLLAPAQSPRAGNVLFPPLPARGQRAGRAGVLPSPPPRPGASRRHHGP